MQLLNEMIKLNERTLLSEDAVLLLEVLGTLSVIDRDLVKALKKATYNKQTTKLGPVVGQKSKVEKKVAVGKNGDQLWKHFEENEKIVAMVLNYGGTQVMAISDRARMMAAPDDASYSGPSYKDANKSTIFTLTTPDFFKLVMTEDEFNEAFGKKSFDRANSKNVYDNKSRELKGGSTQARSFVRKLLDVLVKKARTESKDVEVLYIYKDEERAATKADRAVAKAGSIPTPDDKKIVGRGGQTEYGAYIDGLKSGLRARLDAFKAGKAKNFDSTEEMLEYVKTEGYLDKIKVKGVDYQLRNANFYFENMLAKSKGKTDWHNSDSYVEYQADSKDIWDAAKAIALELQKANPELSATDARDQAIESPDMAPKSIKVMFSLKGGMIVPSEIKVGKY
jgi:hypothetical protein